LKNNITYLLGAGASAECLPIYKRTKKNSHINNPDSFENRLKEFKKIPNIDKSKLPEHIDKILDELKYHISVDTIAKKLWLNRNYEDNNNKLNALKNTIAIFLIYEQMVHHPDMRYDSFIATTLKENDRTFDNNTKIITWNYDIQFELAARKYFPDLQNKKIGMGYESMFNLQEKLNIYPYVQTESSDKTRTDFDYDKFGIIRLNGTAGLFLGKGGVNLDFIIDIYSEDADKNKQDILKQLPNFIDNYQGQIDNTFTYSWENTEISKKGFENAHKIVKKTNILVIIGYSFPIFNKRFDDKFMKSLPANSKIIIQSPECESLKEILLRRYNPQQKNITIELIENTDQFWIPD